MRSKSPRRLDRQIVFLAVVILLSFFVIGIRLWFLQVKLADYYRARIKGSSEVTVRIPSVRGEIRDRKGVPLATNRSSYEIDFYLPDIVSAYEEKYGASPTSEIRTKDSHGMLHDRSTPDIAEIVDREIVPKLKALRLAAPYDTDKLRNHFRNNLLVPFVYRQDIDFTTLAEVAEKNIGLPGVQVNVRPLRRYNYGALAAQILGFVGAPKDIGRLPDIKNFDFYDPDVEGKTNLEYALDDVLRGQPGKRILMKNAWGEVEGEKETVPPVAGSNIFLTIDARIQHIVETTLRAVGRAGAVVVDPNNGEILAMASVPSFDPNKFIPAITPSDWIAIKNAQADPLTNRAISTYAPGSVYKVVTALAGLTRGLANARFTCTGGIWYGNTYMRCWGVHGNQNLIEAITHSCDVYFYQYGNAAGIDAIDRVGQTLGLGQPTGIELTGEDPGLLPSTDWLKITKNERWTPGQTANTSIGQGYVLASPLQMAMVAATIASGGTNYQPTLIHQIQQADGTLIRRPPKIRGDLRRDNGLSPEQIEIVRKGMFNVVNAPDGTGKQGAVPGIQVAGKTGTAQFWRDGIKDNHTWFLAFAPYDHPKVALAVMVEGGKSGGGVAAPIAAEIIQKIFALDQGFNPGLKPMAPAVGNYNLVDSVNFKSDVPAHTTNTGDQDTREPVGKELTARKAIPVQSPEIRPQTNNDRSAQNPLKRFFFNLFRGRSN